MKILRDCDSCPILRFDETGQYICGLNYTVEYLSRSESNDEKDHNVSVDCNLSYIKLLDDSLVSPEWITRK
jgi:hypothetical protein